MLHVDDLDITQEESGLFSSNSYARREEKRRVFWEGFFNHYDVAEEEAEDLSQSLTDEEIEPKDIYSLSDSEEASDTSDIGIEDNPADPTTDHDTQKKDGHAELFIQAPHPPQPDVENMGAAAGGIVEEDAENAADPKPEILPPAHGEIGAFGGGGVEEDEEEDNEDEKEEVEDLPALPTAANSQQLSTGRTLRSHGPADPMPALKGRAYNRKKAGEKRVIPATADLLPTFAAYLAKMQPKLDEILARKKEKINTSEKDDHFLEKHQFLTKIEAHIRKHPTGENILCRSQGGFLYRAARDFNKNLRSKKNISYYYNLIYNVFIQ